MSDFGLFEASVDTDESPARRARVAADRLTRAVDEVRAKYGPFLLAASGLDEFDDRFAYSRKDIVADVVKHVPTYPNVMRAVHGALKADYKKQAANDEDGDGLPEGADDTESKAKKKREKKEHKESRQRSSGKGPVHPGANASPEELESFYRAMDEHYGTSPDSPLHTDNRKRGSRRHLAGDRDAPLLDTDETFEPSDDQLIPDPDFDAYLDEVDQGGPGKVERADFGTGGDTGSARMAAMIYTDWAHTNGMRATSMATLQRYAATGASQGELTALAALIQRKAAEEDEDAGPVDDEGGDNPFEGDDDSDDDGGEDTDEGGEDFGEDAEDEGGELEVPADVVDDVLQLPPGTVEQALAEQGLIDENGEFDDSPGDEGPTGEEFGGGGFGGGGFPGGEEPPAGPPPSDEAFLQQQIAAARRYADDIGMGAFTGIDNSAAGVPSTDSVGMDAGLGGTDAASGAPGGGAPGMGRGARRRQAAPGDPMDPMAAGGAPPMGPGMAGGQPPMDPTAAAGGAPAPAPLENQPAEDDLLGVASQAVNEMIQRETLEFQQVIDPLNQAMQAIEYAQAVEQMENPLDVMPQDPSQALNVDPSQAPDAQAAQEQMMMAQGGGQPPMDPAAMQQQAYRIARRFRLTAEGHQAVIDAVTNQRYASVADGVASLPPAQRPALAASLSDLFAATNGRFLPGKFYTAALGDEAGRRPFVGSTTREGGDTKGWGQLPVLDGYDFPGSADRTSIPNDGMDVNNLPTMDGQAKSAAGKPRGRGVMDKWDRWNKSRQEKGLNHGGKPAVDQFKTEVGVGDKAVGKLEKNLGLSDGGDTEIEASPAATKVASFFTRRVPGWNWDDHLNGYITTAARDFTCACGEQHPTPSHNVCKCGKIWNSYVIASGDGDGRTANVDMYVCREIPVRDGVIMASRKHACTDDCGCDSGAEDTEWVTDADREDADAPHAPGKVAAIGEDDHVIDYRDGERYCRNCDALLWDPNVHHCPAKQASRRFADWTVYDDAPDLGGPSEPPSTVIAAPPSDWARRGDGGKWVPPMFAR